MHGDILVLRGEEIRALLDGKENELIAEARNAYLAHASGNSGLPHSTFLRFPGDQRNRIIALPAYLGYATPIAGVKWISSFPGNLELGIDRASAVVVLNSASTGRPEAVLEGSIISAKRTAASAALSAQHLHADRRVDAVGLIGCGLINFEIIRFLMAIYPELGSLVIFDTDESRSNRFKEACETFARAINVRIARDAERVLSESSLISFATTANAPHVPDISMCPPGSVILHISLRDLTPQVILSCDNVVDDIDHVCRAQTSVHLAEQLTGRRDFIRSALADILNGSAPARKRPESIVVFSPFGLGILDIAVGKLALDMAAEQGKGTVIESFLPDHWSPAK